MGGGSGAKMSVFWHKIGYFERKNYICTEKSICEILCNALAVRFCPKRKLKEKASTALHRVNIRLAFLVY